MKKVLSIFLIFVIIITLLTGCFGVSGDIGVNNVNFYVGDELYASKSVSFGSTVSMPTSPEKGNRIFVGWYTGGVFSSEFDFSTPIYTDLNLYAYFTLDAAKITNMITNEVMKSVVTIKNKSYNTTMGGWVETDFYTSQGSGVVIDISGGWCYVLTNCHVVTKENGFEKQTITVEDAWGETYEAQIYKNANKTELAMSEEYDLALVCFKYAPASANVLAEISIAEDVKIGEDVISLGTPEGQKNAITCGNAISYQKINTEDGDEISKITFDVLIHNATIKHGSSGGPLLNSEGKLVGLNFAGFNDGTYGCAIPMSKINEFLDEFVYVK